MINIKNRWNKWKEKKRKLIEWILWIDSKDWLECDIKSWNQKCKKTWSSWLIEWEQLHFNRSFNRLLNQLRVNCFNIQLFTSLFIHLNTSTIHTISNLSISNLFIHFNLHHSKLLHHLHHSHSHRRIDDLRHELKSWKKSKNERAK